jgi:predicted CopG family antitoxin
MVPVAATTITVSRETRKLLESLKTGGATYDDVIRGLMVAHPTQLTMAELARRIRVRKSHPIEDLIALSRRQPY